jgi:hypothetical protein
MLRASAVVLAEASTDAMTATAASVDVMALIIALSIQFFSSRM